MRIRPEVREQHCKTLRLALHVWLDQYPEDFKEPPNYPCLNQLEAFTQRIMPGSELDEKVQYVLVVHMRCLDRLDIALYTPRNMITSKTLLVDPNLSLHYTTYTHINDINVTNTAFKNLENWIVVRGHHRLGSMRGLQDTLTTPSGTSGTIPVSGPLEDVYGKSDTNPEHTNTTPTTRQSRLCYGLWLC